MGKKLGNNEERPKKPRPQSQQNKQPRPQRQPSQQGQQPRQQNKQPRPQKQPRQQQRIIDSTTEVRQNKLSAFFKKNKFIGYVGLGVVAVVGVVSLKSFFFTGGSSFYDTTKAIFNNDLGTFKFVLDVRTGAKGTILKEVSENNATLDDLNNM